jgi:hypothetical protein
MPQKKSGGKKAGTAKDARDHKPVGGTRDAGEQKRSEATTPADSLLGTAADPSAG